MVIERGHVIDPKTGLEGFFDLLIEDGKITKIGTVSDKTGHEIINGRGLIVAPGLVDVHVHFRDPGFTYKEDILTGAMAAARGGFTTVICMANTNPVIDNVETLSYVLEEGKKTDIHVLSAAAVTIGLKGKELVNMQELYEHGACGFTDDGIPIMDEKLVCAAMEVVKKLNVPISFHEENPAFITNNGINHGMISDQLGLEGSPAIAEDIMVARDCMLALHTGACVNIQHISSKNSVELIRMAKKLGANIIAEATPHHFTLTEEAIMLYGTLAKMNPPLRSQVDREAIIEGIVDGTIDLIATDHAPHSQEEKEKALVEAPSGIIGLETSLALGITCFVKKNLLNIMDFIGKMTYNPAKLYHLNAGTIEEGGPADLVIFDADEAWTVDSFASKSCNSPFVGEQLYGKVKYTICGGKIVYKDYKSLKT